MGNVLMLTNIFSVINDQCYHHFLGFLPWNFYLDMEGPDCTVTNFHVLGSSSSLLLILLAILDDLFRVVGLLAVIFVIYAGVQFILSTGAPDAAAKARTTVINALVGLGISMVAIGFVTFIGSQVDNRRAGQSGKLSLFSLPNPADIQGSGLIQTALSATFGILGAVAFLVIVIAGMQYVFSQGDAQTTAKAKRMIVYALVGLVLAIVAQSIVSFALQYKP